MEQENNNIWQYQFSTNAFHLQIEAHPNSIGSNQHFASICRIVEYSRLGKLCAWNIN